MILQRLASAICQQNWSQIIIEILIVVIGIFLGLQVTDWNEERINLELEKNYLTKLHSDTDQLIELASPSTLTSKLIGDNLKELSQLLIDNQDDADITKLQCNSLAYTHIYVTSIVSLPTLNELLSSGQILLIHNENIRRLISEFTLQTEKTMILLNSLQADKFDFLREYSDIIKINSLQAGNEENFDKLLVECDYQLMLNNDEFKNRLLGNTARYNAHVTVKVSQLDALRVTRPLLSFVQKRPGQELGGLGGYSVKIDLIRSLGRQQDLGKIKIAG